MSEFEVIRAARIKASREFLASVGLDAPHDRPHEMAGSKRKRDSRSPDPRKALASSDDEIEVTGYHPAPPMRSRINVNHVPPNVDRVPPNVNRVPPNVNRVPPNVNRVPPNINPVPPWLKKPKKPTARTKPETIIISSDEEKYALPRPKSFGTSQSHKPSAVYTSSGPAVGLDIKPKTEGQSVQPQRTGQKRNLSQARIHEEAHLSGRVDTNLYFKAKVGGAAGPSIQPPRKRVKTQKPQNDTKLNPIIVLSSSDDEPKLETPDVGLESDSDSDYDNFHGGYDMHWSTSSPGPDPEDHEDPVDSIGAAVAKLSLNRVKSYLPSDSRWSDSLKESSHAWASSFVHKGPPSFLPPRILRPTGPLQVSYGGGRSRTGLLKHRPSQLQTPLTRLKRHSGFRMADACHSISQTAGKFLVASATPGGTMTDENRREEFVIDPYNTPETLAIWTEGQNEKWLPAHYINSNDPGGVGGPFRRKFYDVQCARFDPLNSNIFASTGLDGVLTVWSLIPPDLKVMGVRRPTSSIARYEPVKRWGRETYGGNSCLDIVYRPPSLGGSRVLFAAPCQDGTLFIHSYSTDPLSEQVSQFSIRPCRIADAEHVKHAIGATVWGKGFTANDIFVCSEVENGDLTFHGAIDIESGRPMYHFDDLRSGEELALDPEGSTLALFTVNEDLLSLRMYDVRRHNKRARAAIKLPPASSQLAEGVWPEVRTVAWSPDGILLAVGKNDDVAHVYDVRCLGRGPVVSLRHHTRKSHYGITMLAWTAETNLRTPNLGLVTGGGDHCIALWDVRTACEEREVLAELNGQVGVGSLGNYAQGEKPLVAGDIDGHVYIYDFVDGVY